MNSSISGSTASRRIRILTSALLALAVLVSVLPGSAQAATSCVAYYTIQKGDVTSKIAHTFGLRWREIATANKMEYPYKLIPGDQLCIPAKGSTTTTSSFKYTAYSVNNLISTTASGVSTRSVFYVKVRDANHPTTGWYKIGRLKVPKNSKVTGYYVLPKELRSAVMLQICLKNATTDELTCRTVVHAYR